MNRDELLDKLRDQRAASVPVQPAPPGLPHGEHPYDYGYESLSDRQAEIAARADAATPGPWKAGGTESSQSEWITTGNGRFYVDGVVLADAEFIAHAREDVPWLLAKIKHLTVQPAPSGPALTEPDQGSGDHAKASVPASAISPAVAVLNDAYDGSSNPPSGSVSAGPALHTDREAPAKAETGDDR